MLSVASHGRRAAAHGATLLEVLTAMGLTAVILLALGSAHLRVAQALRAEAHDALSLILLADMAARIRLNPAADLQAYHVPPIRASVRPTSAPHNPCEGLACGPEQMAASDVAAWWHRVQWSLPDSALWIEVDTAPARGRVSMWLRWSAPPLWLGASRPQTQPVGLTEGLTACPAPLLNLFGGTHQDASHDARCAKVTVDSTGQADSRAPNIHPFSASLFSPVGLEAPGFPGPVAGGLNPMQQGVNHVR